jgi:hypothetical protein
MPIRNLPIRTLAIRKPNAYTHTARRMPMRNACVAYTQSSVILRIAMLSLRLLTELVTRCIGFLPLSTIVCTPIVCADVPMCACVTLLCFLFPYSRLCCFVSLPLLSVCVGHFWRSNLGKPKFYHALLLR